MGTGMSSSALVDVRKNKVCAAGKVMYYSNSDGNHRGERLQCRRSPSGLLDVVQHDDLESQRLLVVFNSHHIPLLHSKELIPREW